MAADILDNAVDLQATLNATALEHQLKQNRFHLVSREECIDCDIAIDPKRRALGGVERCTECEGDHQRELFQKLQKALR